jgi:hypothetical protein
LAVKNTGGQDRRRYQNYAGGACHPVVMSHTPDPLSFSLEILKEHRRLKRSSWKYLRSTKFLVILTSPLIYVCAVPFVFLDLAVALYQAVCFPIYGIPRVRRKDYLIFDRGRLAYLNTIEKSACAYCSYANGLLAYIREIAARTEQHFCPIRHSRPIVRPHSRYDHFLPYGDAQAYRARSEAVACDYKDLVTRIAPASPQNPR